MTAGALQTRPEGLQGSLARACHGPVPISRSATSPEAGRAPGYFGGAGAGGLPSDYKGPRDGPGTTRGDMFERPGVGPRRLFFRRRSPNEQARALPPMGGAYPPDLSLITKAAPSLQARVSDVRDRPSFHPVFRRQGPDYVGGCVAGALKTRRRPASRCRKGSYYKTSTFPGHAIKMPKPAQRRAQVTYDDGSPATVAPVCQGRHDVS